MLGGLENIICTNINILTLRSDLDPECSNTSFSLDTLIYDGVSSDQVWFPGNQQFRKYSTKSHVLIICVIAMTFTLKKEKENVCMTLWFMMLHDHTKFSNKMFCGSENIIRTNSH